MLSSNIWSMKFIDLMSIRYIEILHSAWMIVCMYVIPSITVYPPYSILPELGRSLYVCVRFIGTYLFMKINFRKSQSPYTHVFIIIYIPCTLFSMWERRLFVRLLSASFNVAQQPACEHSLAKVWNQVFSIWFQGNKLNLFYIFNKLNFL